MQPTGPQPSQGQALNRLLQGWMSAVLGDALESSLIRPYTQAEPPAVPDRGVAWMAFTQRAESSDTFPFVTQKRDGSGASLSRHEVLRVLCSFYDTGTEGRAAELASLLRDGLSIPDNLEFLSINSMGFLGCEDEVAMPSLLKEQWLWRVDLPIRLSRAVNRDYAVPNIEIVDGVVHYDTGLKDQPIHVEPST